MCLTQKKNASFTEEKIAFQTEVCVLHGALQYNEMTSSQG